MTPLEEKKQIVEKFLSDKEYGNEHVFEAYKFIIQSVAIQAAEEKEIHMMKEFTEIMRYGIKELGNTEASLDSSIRNLNLIKSLINKSN